MIEIDQLPHVTASLNLAAAICLFTAYRAIRSGDKAKHKKMMLSAVGISVLFLIVYTTYHLMGGFAKFGGEGIARPIYFTILVTHVIGAVIILPLVPFTLYQSISCNFAKHKRFARWTWPLWMFVSVSGVIVYIMAVHLFPS